MEIQKDFNKLSRVLRNYYGKLNISQIATYLILREMHTLKEKKYLK